MVCLLCVVLFQSVVDLRGMSVLLNSLSREVYVPFFLPSPYTTSSKSAKKLASSLRGRPTSCDRNVRLSSFFDDVVPFPASVCSSLELCVDLNGSVVSSKSSPPGNLFPLVGADRARSVQCSGSVDVGREACALCEAPLFNLRFLVGTGELGYSPSFASDDGGATGVLLLFTFRE